MALFLNDKDNRSELQSRLASELQERLKQKQLLEYDKPEPSLLENQHTTRAAGLVIVIVVVIAVGVILYLLRP
jgi:hypothetical protein